jgi:hypothetical protein
MEENLLGGDGIEAGWWRKHIPANRAPQLLTG